MGRIKVDYATLEEASQIVTSNAQDIESQLGDLRSMLQNLDFTGAARDAYQEAQDQWDNSMEDIRSILEALGNAINTAKENYLATEAANVSRFQ